MEDNKGVFYDLSTVRSGIIFSSIFPPSEGMEYWTQFDGWFSNVKSSRQIRREFREDSPRSAMFARIYLEKQFVDLELISEGKNTLLVSRRRS